MKRCILTDPPQAIIQSLQHKTCGFQNQSNYIRCHGHIKHFISFIKRGSPRIALSQAHHSYFIHLEFKSNVQSVIRLDLWQMSSKMCQASSTNLISAIKHKISICKTKMFEQIAIQKDLQNKKHSDSEWSTIHMTYLWNHPQSNNDLNGFSQQSSCRVTQPRWALGVPSHAFDWSLGCQDRSDSLPEFRKALAPSQRCLVGGWTNPFEKYEFVNWDDDYSQDIGK